MTTPTVTAPKYRSYRPFIQHAQDETRMELLRLAEPYEMRSSDATLDRLYTARYDLAMADKPRHDTMKIKIATLPARAKVLKKAYDQYLHYENRMQAGEEKLQEEKQKHRAEAAVAEARIAELENYKSLILNSKVSDAMQSAKMERERHNDINHSLQRRLNKVAAIRKINLNPEDALGDQLDAFILLSDTTSSLTEREAIQAEFKANYEQMKNRCQEAIRRSSEKNGFQVYEGGDVENNLNSFIAEVNLLYGMTQSYKDVISRMVHTIQSDTEIAVQLPPQTNPEVAMHLYTARVQKRIDENKETTEKISRFEHVLNEAYEKLNFKPLLTWTLIRKLRGYCEFVQDALKEKDKACKVMRKRVRELEEDFAEATSKVLELERLTIAIRRKVLSR